MVLVDDPVEGGARTNAVVESLGRDSGEGHRFVHVERMFVRGEFHFRDPLTVWEAFGLDSFEGPSVEQFVVDVEPRQLLTCGDKGVKIRGEGDAREVAFEVGGKPFAVFGMVKQRVNVRVLLSSDQSLTSAGKLTAEYGVEHVIEHIEGLRQEQLFRVNAPSEDREPPKPDQKSLPPSPE